MAEKQPSIGEVVGPPPPWLMNAFNEAERQYGKQKFTIDPETVAAPIVQRAEEIQLVDRKYRLESDEPDEFMGVYVSDKAPEAPPPAKASLPLNPRRASLPMPEPIVEEPKAKAAEPFIPSQEDRFFGRREDGAFAMSADPVKAPKALKFPGSIKEERGTGGSGDNGPSDRSSDSAERAEAPDDAAESSESSESRGGARGSGPGGSKASAR